MGVGGLQRGSEHKSVELSTRVCSQRPKGTPDWEFQDIFEFLVVVQHFLVHPGLACQMGVALTELLFCSYSDTPAISASLE